MKRLARLGFGMGLTLWLAAVAVRLTVRDTSWPVNGIYYATPWPVLAAGALALARLGPRRLRWMLGSASLLCAGVWLHGSWHWSHAAFAEPELRVVQWNVDRPGSGLPAVARRLRELQADVIAIAEARPKHEDTSARWAAEFPEYQAIFAPGNLLCLVRGEVLRHEQGLLVLGSYYSASDVRVRGRVVTILQADFAAQLDQVREKPLRALTARAAEEFGKPLIVVGDFNTPRDSRHFETLRQTLANAWETAGSGLAETWPWPLPVLALDQVWSSPELRTVQCRQGGSWHSDHRWVVADFAFTPQK